MVTENLARMKIARVYADIFNYQPQILKKIVLWDSDQEANTTLNEKNLVNEYQSVFLTKA